jgi:two-component system response regulator FixJ
VTAAPVVHLVDDDPSVRRSLRRLLLASGHAVTDYPTALEFLGCRPDGPGCVILDLRMPDISGLEVLGALLAGSGVLRVVVLSGHADVDAAVSAMKLGAVDLLAKPVEDARLLDTVGRACRLSLAAWDERQHRRDLHRRHASLTRREAEVARLVSRGWLNKQIAGELGTAVKTVKAHRGKVMRKLGVSSVADLVRLMDRVEEVS